MKKKLLKFIFCKLLDKHEEEFFNSRKNHGWICRRCGKIVVRRLQENVEDKKDIKKDS